MPRRQNLLTNPDLRSFFSGGVSSLRLGMASAARPHYSALPPAAGLHAAREVLHLPRLCAPNTRRGSPTWKGTSSPQRTICSCRIGRQASRFMESVLSRRNPARSAASALVGDLAGRRTSPPEGRRPGGPVPGWRFFAPHWSGPGGCPGAGGRIYKRMRAIRDAFAVLRGRPAASDDADQRDRDAGT